MVKSLFRLEVVPSCSSQAHANTNLDDYGGCARKTPLVVQFRLAQTSHVCKETQHPLEGTPGDQWHSLFVLPETVLMFHFHSAKGCVDDILRNGDQDVAGDV